MAIQSNFPAIKPSLLLDFANTKQLDPRITFTRASTATFYNGVTTAMAEQNLTTYSQAFTLGGLWVATGSTVVDNSTVAPDGTTTASLVTASAGSSFHGFSNSGLLVSGTPYTMSIFVKAGTSNFVGIGSNQGLGGATFNLSTQTVITGTGTITSVGNGWYRLSTYINAGGAKGMFFGLTDASGNATFTAVGTETASFWGAQAEQRNVLTSYTLTTTQAITNYIPVLQTASSGVARFDNNPTTGESLGLLIEESRTNLVLYSEDYSNAAWNKVASTITSNTIVAPDGALTGDKIVASTATNIHTTNQAVSVSSGASYTLSAFIKSGEETTAALSLSNSPFPRVKFNLTTGAIISSQGGGTGTITAVGNGWYRCTMTSTTPSASVSPTIAIRDTDTNWTGDGFGGIYIWGAQFEAGAFATSYIPTVASQVTRAADNASITGTNFSSWFNYGEMTIYWEAAGYYNDGGFEVFDFDSGSNVGRIRTRFSSSSQVDQIDATGGLPVTLDGGTVTAKSFSKLAAGLTQSSQALAFNNGAVVTSSASFTSLPVPTNARIGTNWVPSEFLNGTIKKIAYYPFRVTNTQLQALTS
jgi:hypothetical protein